MSETVTLRKALKAADKCYIVMEPHREIEMTIPVNPSDMLFRFEDLETYAGGHLNFPIWESLDREWTGNSMLYSWFEVTLDTTEGLDVYFHFYPLSFEEGTFMSKLTDSLSIMEQAKKEYERQTKTRC